LLGNILHIHGLRGGGGNGGDHVCFDLLVSVEGLRLNSGIDLTLRFLDGFVNDDEISLLALGSVELRVLGEGASHLNFFLQSGDLDTGLTSGGIVFNPGRCVLAVHLELIVRAFLGDVLDRDSNGSVSSLGEDSHDGSFISGINRTRLKIGVESTLGHGLDGLESDLEVLGADDTSRGLLSEGTGVVDLLDGFRGEGGSHTGLHVEVHVGGFLGSRLEGSERLDGLGLGVTDSTGRLEGGSSVTSPLTVELEGRVTSVVTFTVVSASLVGGARARAGGTIGRSSRTHVRLTSSHSCETEAVTVVRARLGARAFADS
jgi:hypothetical protein